MTVDTVISDIGNVLIEWQPECYYDGVIGEASRRALFDAMVLSSCFLRFVKCPAAVAQALISVA